VDRTLLLGHKARERERERERDGERDDVVYVSSEHPSVLRLLENYQATCSTKEKNILSI
jgi:hypothetical protein